MNSIKFKYFEKANYLGVIICNDLKDDEDMLTYVDSINNEFNKCSIGVKLHRFHAHCCTMYCSQHEVNLNKSINLKLKVAYNNMHRQILGYNRWSSTCSMFANNAIDNFSQL